MVWIQMAPVLTAFITAAILLFTPNFWIALCTWKLMVRSLMLRILEHS